MNQNILNIENFLDKKLPIELRNKYQNCVPSLKINSESFGKYIDFYPPFIKTEKIIIFNEHGKSEESKSIGVGTVTLENTQGHYNSTIYLAYAGFLMASTASIHLGVLFPDTAPQAYEGNKVCVMPGKILNNGIIKPQKKGSTFYVETVVKKKKMKLYVVDTFIYFGSISYGMIENLKIILTEKKSIYSALEIPEVI